MQRTIIHSPYKSLLAVFNGQFLFDSDGVCIGFAQTDLTQFISGQFSASTLVEWMLMNKAMPAFRIEVRAVFGSITLEGHDKHLGIVTLNTFEAGDGQDILPYIKLYVEKGVDFILTYH